jgi:hypothetical protein
MDYVIGIDLDNTIINFDRLIFSVSYDLQYIDKNIPRNKTAIRDRIWTLPDGDFKWQKVQSIVYGSKITEAGLFPGVRRFLKQTVKKKIPVYIVSHKKLFTGKSDSGINLRDKAREFLSLNSVSGDKGGFIPQKDVYFENSREDKIRRIIKLKCTHFIDDLPETFAHVMFPRETVRILFDPHAVYQNPVDVNIMGSWKNIYDYFYGN